MEELTLQESILYNIYFEFQKTKYKDFDDIRALVLSKIFKDYCDFEEIKNFLGGELKDKRDKVFEQLGRTYRGYLQSNNFLNFTEPEINFLRQVSHLLVIIQTKEYINKFEKTFCKKMAKYNSIDETTRLKKVIKLIEENNTKYNFDEDNEKVVKEESKLDKIYELLLNQQKQIDELFTYYKKNK